MLRDREHQALLPLMKLDGVRMRKTLSMDGFFLRLKQSNVQR
ncbi:hypothetical protein OAN61_00950 [bacterium]|nr:hypothetical protein [bacterium]